MKTNLWNLISQWLLMTWLVLVVISIALAGEQGPLRDLDGHGDAGDGWVYGGEGDKSVGG